ncbi:hypothetical protein QQF64_007867 [Cirrhinus molitorella]|uniref:Uncharacterized protein n=1 Tax=Cirrhinus molitorella TaxID=172907 RepID=A0ABR3M5E8_9TELE
MLIWAWQHLISRYLAHYTIHMNLACQLQLSFFPGLAVFLPQTAYLLGILLHLPYHQTAVALSCEIPLAPNRYQKVHVECASHPGNAHAEAALAEADSLSRWLTSRFLNESGPAPPLLRYVRIGENVRSSFDLPSWIFQAD